MPDLNALLNPNHVWNIALLTGGTMVILSVLCEKQRLCLPLRQREVAIGPFSSRGCTLLQVLGTFLILASIAVVALTNFGGLISPMQRTGLLEVAVHAAVPEPDGAQRKPPPSQETVRIKEGEIKGLARAGNEQLFAYVSEIGLVGESQLLVFAASSPPRGPRGAEDLRNDLHRMKARILLDRRIKSGFQTTIEHRGLTMRVQVQLRWYAVGANFAEVTVERLPAS